MSYTIDYQRKAYEYHDRYSGKAFVILSEAGDNNVWEIDNRRRVRHWNVLFHGSAWSVYHNIADYCGNVAGGSLQLRGHRRVGDYAKDITAAIRLYDRTIKSASPLENLFKDHSLMAEVRVTAPPDAYAKKALNDYLTKYDLTLQPRSTSGQLVQRASMKVSNTEQLLDTLDGDQGWGDSHILLRVTVN